MSNCTEALANADIAGPGVRISFYVQAVLLSILSCRSQSPNEVTGSLYASIGSITVYTITSIVSAAQNAIALSEAIFVTYLVGLASVGILASLISYSKFRKDRPDRKVEAAAIVQLYLALSCSIALWALAPHFGNNIECNTHVLFVIFGSFPVFPTARILWLVLLPLLTAAYTVTLYYDYLHGPKRGEKRDSLLPTSRSSQGSPSPSTDRKSKKPRIDGSLLVQLFVIIVVFALLILNAELYLNRNFNGSQRGQWGFGQVSPMFLVFIPLIGVWKGFRENGLSKRVPAD
ncbi:hypothetical protein BOTBODRAFT_189694 [Botryobasidium botryosum FD-172 SS1]|uniref:Uncharacterized protein n=1 Tax=Botryobasidium botryosum (strain FD-172 SS1) TaxID=930990 RepID=A0A067MAI0_BOTB1|nr:hypothetical protein BOTBODRAFT_189694 [Botryobasidium botryosum FD-172 SS1]